MDQTLSDPLPECDDAAPQALLRGVMQFNRGEYYPCHETLEALWMEEERPVRRLYQGILQIAVALHHWRQGNHRGAVALLAGGREKLAALPDLCRQVDIAALRRDSALVQKRLEDLGPQGADRLAKELIPRIHLRPRAPEGQGGKCPPGGRSN